ncbi:MAG: FIG00799646: hypothetical protein, partial [uncultured Rubrobacteraceae bacterium]
DGPPLRTTAPPAARAPGHLRLQGGAARRRGPRLPPGPAGPPRPARLVRGALRRPRHDAPRRGLWRLRRAGDHRGPRRAFGDPLRRRRREAPPAAPGVLPGPRARGRPKRRGRPADRLPPGRQRLHADPAPALGRGAAVGDGRASPGSVGARRRLLGGYRARRGRVARPARDQRAGGRAHARARLRPRPAGARAAGRQQRDLPRPRPRRRREARRRSRRGDARAARGARGRGHRGNRQARLDRFRHREPLRRRRRARAGENAAPARANRLRRGRGPRPREGAQKGAHGVLRRQVAQALRQRARLPRDGRRPGRLRRPGPARRHPGARGREVLAGDDSVAPPRPPRDARSAGRSRLRRALRGRFLLPPRAFGGRRRARGRPRGPTAARRRPRSALRGSLAAGGGDLRDQGNSPGPRGRDGELRQDRGPQPPPHAPPGRRPGRHGRPAPRRPANTPPRRGPRGVRTIPLARCGSLGQKGWLPVPAVQGALPPRGRPRRRRRSV